MQAIKVVLTGGPCAGKTTILNILKKELIKKGYKIIINNESATDLILSGIYLNNIKNLLKFQDFIFCKQLTNEKIIDEAINFNYSTKPCIILYDRGIIDNKAYINQDQFNYILEKNNSNEINLLDSYDLVIDLITTAKCNPNVYNLASNKARTETKEEAIKIDSKTTWAWLGHNNMHLISTNNTIEDEVNLIMTQIEILLNNIENKKKSYQVTCNQDFYLNYNQNNSKIIDVTKLSDTNNNVLTTRTFNNNTSYFLNNTKISKYDYLSSIDNNEITNNIKQKELYFAENNNLYKMIFPSTSNKIFLEILSDNNKKNLTPSNIKIIDNNYTTSEETKKRIKKL